MVTPLERLLPGLARSGYRVTSPAANNYNCVAWAAGDIVRWWWPVPADVQDAFWPAGVVREETLAAFRDAFAALGYAEASGQALQPGVEKVALFANERGVPLHAARQLANGLWTSKLGELEDVEHALEDLQGDAYGAVALIMERPLSS